MGAAGEAIGKHYEAKADAIARESALRETQLQVALVRLVTTRPGVDAYGQPIIQLQFANGSIHETAAIGVTVTYLSGTRPVAQDPNCGGPARIAGGASVWLACALHAVPGATGYQVQITGVEFAQ